MKKTTLLGTAMAVMLMGTVVGCSNDTEKEPKDNKVAKTEEVAKEKEVEKTDEELVKEIGKVENPVFSEIKQADLTDEQKKIATILQNAVGVNLHEDLFLVVPKQGENKLRYITETHEDGKVKVFLKKVEADEKGQDMIIGKVKDLDKHEVWFIDAETNEPIQLEDLEELTKEKVDEKAKADTVETKDKDAKGEPVAKKEESKDESKATSKETKDKE